jgi:YVTN family beta-propeller protein
MAATSTPSARRSISLRSTVPCVVAILAVVLFLAPGGALGQTPVASHPSGAPHAPSAVATPSPSAASSPATPENLPIGQAAGSVAATLAPWADYAATGYHKLSGEPQDFGPAAYDPATGDLWIAQSSPTWYQSPAEVLEVNANTLVPAGIVPGLNNASGIAFDPANSVMYVSDPGTDSVLPVNALTGASAGPAIKVGPGPTNLTFNPGDSLMYVLNAGNHSVSAINTTSDLVVKWSGNLGSATGQLAYDPVNNLVAVLLPGGLDWLRGTSLYNVSFQAVAYPAESVAVDEHGWAYVGDAAGDFDVFNQTMSLVLNAGLGGSNANCAVFDPGLPAIFFTDLSTNTVSEVDSATQTYVTGYTLASGDGMTDLVLVPGTHQLDVLNSAFLYPGFYQGPYLYQHNPFGRTVLAVDGLTGAVNATSPNLAASPSSLLYDPDGGLVVQGDIYSDNLTFVPATDPLAGPLFTVYLNGTPGQMAYDPLTHTIWVPMLTGPGGCCGGNNPQGDIFVLNASTGAEVTLLYPNGHNNYDAVTQVVFDAQNRSMIVGIFWNDVPWISLISMNATTYALGPQLTPAGLYYYASSPNIPQMAYDPVHQQLYVTSPGNNTVMIFNAKTLRQEAVDHVGNQPTGIAFDSADGDVYVVNTESYNLTIINGTSRAVVVAGVQLSGVPVYIGYDPDTELLYVGVENGVGPFPINLETSLVVLDGSSLGAVWGPWPTIYVGWASVYPMDGITFVPSNNTGTPGQIWTANTWDGSVTVVSIPPTASLVASPSTFGQGTPVVLTGVVVGGTDGLSYTYSGLPSGCASASTPTLTCTPSATGTFTVTLTVTDGLGLHAAASATFTVTAGLSVSASVSPTSTDVGRMIWANATAAGGAGGTTYAWAFGDGGSASVADATHVYTMPGTYTVNVNVTDRTGVARSWSTSVEVNPAPAVRILGVVSSVVLGTPLDLSAETSGGTTPLSSVAWSFGDATTGSGDWVSHIYAATGEFRIYANVTDAWGEMASAWTDINVTAPTTSPLAATLTEGANWTEPGAPVTFVATASGGAGGYSYAWWLNGTVVSGATAWTYTLTPKGAGNFTVSVTVTDAKANTASAKVVLEVLPPKVTTITTTVPGKPQYNNVSTPASVTIGDLAPYLAGGLVIGLILGLVVGLLMRRDRKATTPPTSATKDEDASSEEKGMDEEKKEDSPSSSTPETSEKPSA